jgi:plastocyanin
MTSSVRFGRPLALACAAAMFGCGGDGQPLSPSSPTQLAAPGASLSVRPFDYHEVPAPTPDPLPDPGPAPAPAPVPTTVTIGIVGSAGSGAFAPNPIHAAVGDMIVWRNNDATLHHLVLGDGTAIGNIAPGQSSAPIALTATTASYRCTIHPSMVGSINDPSAVAPPPPVYEPPPYGPPDPYDDYSHKGRSTAARSR